jgi:hypothetical protein
MMLDGFSVDQSMSASQSLGKNTSTVITHSTSASGEVAGFETLGQVSGSQDQINSWYLNFARNARVPYKLGPLEVTTLEWHHLYQTPLPIVGGSRQIKGAGIGNYPVTLPHTFDAHDFEGELLPGWEVELYHNDILVGRQDTPQNGRYHFKDLPLLYGANRFRLDFYGPAGEERSIFRSFQIAGSLVPENETYYRASAGYDTSNNPSISLKAERGLKKGLAAGLAVSRMRINGDTDERTFLVGNVNGYTTNLQYNVSAVKNDENGYAAEADIRLPLDRVLAGLRFTTLNEFRSDLFNRTTTSNLLTQRITASASFPFFFYRTWGSRWELKRNLYESGTDEYEFLNRISTQFRNLSFHHELTITRAAINSWQGKPTVYYRFLPNRLKLGATYGDSGVSSAEIQYRRKLSRTNVAWVSARRDFVSNIIDANASINQQINKWNLGLTIGANNQDNYSIGLTLGCSLSVDSRTRTTHMNTYEQARQGAASIAVFQDANYNLVRDEGELPVQRAQINVHQRNETYHTDDQGAAYVPNLDPHQPVDIQLSTKTFNNIYEFPLIKGTRLWPRKGKTLRVDIPVGILGDADGIVETSSGDQVIRPNRISLELVNWLGKVQATTKPDSSGFYTFERIPPGAYTIRVPLKVRNELGIATEPADQDLFISKDGDSVSGRDFILKKR